MAETPSEEMGSMASLLGAVAATGPAALVAGTVVGGQYRIERPLGEGGMGVVYLARDTRLDRDVAVKVGTAVSPTALRRIEREAVALARLSHPNVVVVFQVGEIEGRVFIAMEHVDGGTARDWLHERPRSWRDIVGLYAAAGDGLAAAHAAGLIHRDFKPDNVLVGGDGRPRVADFGLARAADASEPSPVPAGGEVMLSTQAGAIVGTPAYMPPEQLAGDDLDARADQFAFAAALWESLCGTRPFDGKTPGEVKTAIESKPPAEAPSGEPQHRRVPRHVLVALRRALAADRAARWPDMAALLRALRTDPQARRRRVTLVAAALAVGIAGTAAAVVLTARPTAASPCAEVETGLGAAWTPARREALRAGFVATARPGAAETFDRVAARIDAQLAAIAAHRAQACHATHTRHTQSSQLLDLRNHCLDRRDAEVSGLLAVIGRPDPTVVDGAVAATSTLRDPAECDDVPRLTGLAARPSDPAVRSQLTALEVSIAEHYALESAGKLAEARDGAAADIVRAAELGQPGLGAEATILLASIEANKDGAAALKTLEAAGRLAAEGRDDLMAARVALSTFAVLIINQAQLDEAERLRPLAESALVRAGSPRNERARFLALTSRLHAGKGDLEAARRDIEAALALFEEHHGADDAQLANPLVHLSNILRDQGKLAESLAVTQRVERLLTTAYGPEHPRLGVVLTNLGGTQLILGRYDDAAVTMARALDLKERTAGPAHPSLVMTLINFANLRLKQHRAADAVVLLERARTIATDAMGKDHPAYAHVLSVLSDARSQLGEPAAAEALLEEVLAIQLQAGPDRPDVADTLLGRGRLRLARGDHRGAREDFERIRPIVEKAEGPRSSGMAMLLAAFAELELAERRPSQARRTFEQALAMFTEQLGPEHPDVLGMKAELPKYTAADK